MENRLEVQVFRGETVPMRDGIKLSADIYRPDEKRECPGITIRTPYGKSTDTHHETGMFFAQNSSIVMVTDVKARGDSDGEISEYRNEGADGMVRGRFKKGMDKPELLRPGEIYKFEIDCWNTSHVFKKGHRIRAEVSSSAFPKYDRQLNTGDTLGVTSEMKTAKQTIYHDADHPSNITLAVIPR